MTDFLVRFLTGTLHGIVERIRFGQVIDASKDFVHTFVKRILVAAIFKR